MKKIAIVPLQEDSLDEYIEVGTKSYKQHYLHLWENNNAQPYLRNNFTREKVAQEKADSQTAHFLIRQSESAVGILKIMQHSPVGKYTATEAMLLEKIYILNDYSGQGIGSHALAFIEKYAKDHGKKILWLDTMIKGKALSFYLHRGFKIVGTKNLEYPGIIAAQRGMYILLKSL